MATSTHYPPSLLPWQAPRIDDRNHQSWHITLCPRQDDPHIALLVLKRRAGSGRWNWAILPADLDIQPMRGPGFGYVSIDTCEHAMLAALAAWLHGPPSRHLPSQEGATTGGKEADCA